jgi:hypothetical protein
MRAAETLQDALDLEQFRGLCFDCTAETPEMLDAPRIAPPEWSKTIPPIDHSARLVRLQGSIESA